MKITGMPKVGRLFIISIFIDNVFWKDVHKKIFGSNISIAPCDTMEQLQEKFYILEYAKAKQYALNRLASRSYPSAQLQKLLERNLVSPETIKKILREFRHLGYLNDETWIESFIKTQLKRFIGPQVIIHKLMSKGISLQDAERWVENRIGNSEVQNSIHHLLSTKYRNRNLSDYKEKQKVFSALMRKGFQVDDIQLVFRKFTTKFDSSKT